MNPNIEVITPELWAVNSGYIKAGWEIERRRVRADYLNRLPRLTLKSRIKKFLQKVGEYFGFYQNSD